MFGNVPVNTMSTHRREDHARESNVPLWVAGLRIKIFLALFPAAVHLDTPPGSRSFACKNRAQGIVSRRIVMLEWQPSIAEAFRQPSSCQNEHYACHT